jgi:hypothetical protein
MTKEPKTASELEAMICAELDDPRVDVSVHADPASGWHATPSHWGTVPTELIAKTMQIMQRLRAQYDLKESS